MRRLIFFTTLSCLCFCLTPNPMQAAGLVKSKSRFYYKNSSGKVHSARIIRRYRRVPIVHPPAPLDPNIDPRLRRAATIAEERANARSKLRCWRYVKQALLAAGAVHWYPTTNYASQAGEELVRLHGFKRLPIRDPYQAPLGAVIVYSRGIRGAGHVELRTRNGFASDYWSKNRCRFPLLGVYAKTS